MSSKHAWLLLLDLCNYTELSISGEMRSTYSNAARYWQSSSVRAYRQPCDARQHNQY